MKDAIYVATFRYGARCVCRTILCALRSAAVKVSPPHDYQTNTSIHGGIGPLSLGITVQACRYLGVSAIAVDPGVPKLLSKLVACPSGQRAGGRHDQRRARRIQPRMALPVAIEQRFLPPDLGLDWEMHIWARRGQSASLEQPIHATHQIKQEGGYVASCMV